MIDASLRANAQNYAAPVFSDVNLWLPELMRVTLVGGANVIRGRTFTNCRLEGPAVLLAVGGVEFDGCNMGYNGGDVRNMVLRPAGPKQVIGAIPFQSCRFIRCEFVAVGFTGPESFIQSMLGLTSGKRP